MRTPGISQEWASVSHTQPSRPSSAIPTRGIESMTGQRGLRLTAVDTSRTAQQLHHCLTALSRFLQNPRSTGAAQASPKWDTRSIVRDIDYLHKKASQIDIKTWMKNRQSLSTMIDISRTVLRLAHAVKRDVGSSATHPETEPSFSPPLTVFNGLSEIATSLVDDILQQTGILLEKNASSALFCDSDKRNAENKLLDSIKGDIALTKKLLKAKALPEDLCKKTEALHVLANALEQLHTILKTIIEQTPPDLFETIIAISKDCQSQFLEYNCTINPEFIQSMQETTQALEDTYKVFREFEAKIAYLMDNIRIDREFQDDMVAWLRYMLRYPPEELPYVQATREFRAEDNERISSDYEWLVLKEDQ